MAIKKDDADMDVVAAGRAVYERLRECLEVVDRRAAASPARAD